VSRTEDHQHISVDQLALTAGGNDAVRCMWYMVIHDLVPTNERLHTIHLKTSDAFSKSGETDILMHRITECAASVDI
jgi:hypothetical protein